MIFQVASFIYAKFPQARHPGTLFKKKSHRSPQVGVECHALVFSGGLSVIPCSTESAKPWVTTKRRRVIVLCLPKCFKDVVAGHEYVSFPGIYQCK